jgi:tetratricopeptide (TPR) repeat protein
LAFLERVVETRNPISGAPPAVTREMRRGGGRYDEAITFYEDKLSDNPNMSKYNHNLAAIMQTKGNSERAGELYRQAIASAPNNVMTRNDYALHLAKKQEYLLATKELQKGLLIVEQQPALHANLTAVHGRLGQYDEAIEHAKRARELRPEMAMNLRNLAKIQNHIGDSRTALTMNLQAIELEKKGHHGGYLNTDVYRAAAIQSISKGDQEQALQLVREARQLEQKLFQSPTTDRTNEIIAKITQRKGDKIRQIEKEAKETEERDRLVLRRKRATGK